MAIKMVEVEADRLEELVRLAHRNHSSLTGCLCGRAYRKGGEGEPFTEKWRNEAKAAHAAHVKLMVREALAGRL